MVEKYICVYKNLAPKNQGQLKDRVRLMHCQIASGRILSCSKDCGFHPSCTESLFLVSGIFG